MSVSTNTGRRRQRALMWKLQGGRCYWCDRMTVLPPPGEPRRKAIPKNEATIEHLDSRLSPERGRHPGTYRHVLACVECNNRRSARELAAMLPQSHWERSGNIYGIAKMSGALNEVSKAAA